MAIRKTGTRAYKSNLKKKEITETAIAMFRQYGYETTTMADISHATQCSIGSIYNFFGSKAGILNSAVTTLGEYIIEKDGQWEKKIASPQEAIRDLLFQYSDFFVRFGPELSMHMGRAFYSLYNNEDGSFLETATVRNLTDYVSACQQAGTLTVRRSVDEIVQLILYVMQSTIIYWTRFTFDLHERMAYNLDVLFSDIGASSDS